LGMLLGRDMSMREAQQSLSSKTSRVSLCDGSLGYGPLHVRLISELKQKFSLRKASSGGV
jgi:hypothetical protein